MPSLFIAANAFARSLALHAEYARASKFHAARSQLRGFQAVLLDGARCIEKHPQMRCARKCFSEDLDPPGQELVRRVGDSRDPAAGSAQRLDQTCAHGIDEVHEDDRQARRAFVQQPHGDRGAPDDDQRRLARNGFSDQERELGGLGKTANSMTGSGS